MMRMHTFSRTDDGEGVMNIRGKPKRGRAAIRCGLPEDALGCGARVTWFARGSALVEGQRGVIELSGGRIRLRTDEGVLSICGSALTLCELSLDAAMIAGEQIHTLTYLKPGETP